ncbi:hypothetical protein T440DRAFT_300038 [Plenodomus tracheiphilus IPT5]|uniref:Zn(2)-C6 fungal-type domain-containing protein n=1 Tax=Plenodomus tracheiphilus IPT5 TaxID=1408161 RepID=A0A6A7ARV3_9PLEO|nr:hypothetical protein T440DRAFT_300038 [Plenodomus tracheiphilus IPT5]
MVDLNAIACENCRSKKCKCDRMLFGNHYPTGLFLNLTPLSPSCAQCQTSSLVCRYQEGGKRGLPAAYIQSLEQRLAETEAALSASLCALQHKNDLGLTDTYFSNAAAYTSSRDLSKAEKQNEWRQLPLRTGDDLITWLQARKVHSATVATEPRRYVVPSVGSEQSDDTQRLQHSCTSISRTSAPAEHHTGANAENTSVPFSSVEDQLRRCAPPPNVPNTTSTTWHASQWHDNYF